MYCLKERRAASLSPCHSFACCRWPAQHCFECCAVNAPLGAAGAQIVYEFLLRYVVSNDTDAKAAKKHIDQYFVVRARAGAGRGRGCAGLLKGWLGWCTRARKRAYRAPGAPLTPAMRGFAGCCAGSAPASWPPSARGWLQLQ